MTYITYSCLIILNGSKRCAPRYKKDIAMLMESMIHFLALHLFISRKDNIWVANSTVSDERKMHSIPLAVYEAAVTISLSFFLSYFRTHHHFTVAALFTVIRFRVFQHDSFGPKLVLGCKLKWRDVLKNV